jgi:Putative phage tail protein
MRAALDPIISVLPLSVRPNGNQMLVADWTSHNFVVQPHNPVIAEGRKEIERPKRARAAQSRAPSSLSIRHYDPERDFQAGVQSSRVIGNARTETQLDFAAAVNAGPARGFADAQLLQRWRALNGFEATIARREMRHLVGNILTDPASGIAYRITEIEHQRGTTRVSGHEWAEFSTPTMIADPGRNQPGLDLPVGNTRMLLAELPALGSDDPGQPIMVAAVAGTGSGWRRAALTRVNGSQYTELGGTNGVANMGNLLHPLPAHTALLEDRHNEPLLRLHHDRMTLPPGSGDPLSNDAPALWIGGEIIRYGMAEKIAPRDYRVKKLLRGCFGSDGDIAHPAGSHVVLLEKDSLFEVPIDASSIGTTVTIEAFGIGDEQPVSGLLDIVGIAIRPRVPVHGRIEKLASGDIRLTWVRRDRLVHGWVDGVDLPNSEGVTAFHIELRIGLTKIADWQSDTPVLLISASELAALAVGPAAILDFSIMQQGQFARSGPLALSVTY